MAATADPREKPPARPLLGLSPNVLSPWSGRRMVPCPATDRDRGVHPAPGGHSRSAQVGGQDGGEDDDTGLEELRTKLMGHLREASGRLELPPAPEEQRRQVYSAPAAGEQEADPSPSSVRPWNLRSRRRPAKPSTGGAAAAGAAVTAAWERARFSISLTAEEIEEDIYAVTGSRPRRRPKKRPRIVQRQLDSLFPGMWLCEITADCYKVPDE